MDFSWSFFLLDIIEELVTAVVVGDTPIEAFHDETVVPLVDAHQERRCAAVDPHAVQELILVFFEVVLRIGYHLYAGLNVHFVGELVFVLAASDIKVAAVYSHTQYIDLVCFSPHLVSAVLDVISLLDFISNLDFLDVELKVLLFLLPGIGLNENTQIGQVNFKVHWRSFWFHFNSGVWVSLLDILDILFIILGVPSVERWQHLSVQVRDQSQNWLLSVVYCQVIKLRLDKHFFLVLIGMVQHFNIEI
jgi:hypothetical protein